MHSTTEQADYSTSIITIRITRSVALDLEALPPRTSCLASRRYQAIQEALLQHTQPS